MMKMACIRFYIKLRICYIKITLSCKFTNHFIILFLLPEFQTQKAPVNEYQIIREKAASQKRDVERALTRFIAKTGETQTLIRDDSNLFPCRLIIQSS